MNPLEELERFYRLIEPNQDFYTQKEHGEHCLFVFPLLGKKDQLRFVKQEINQNFPELYYRHYGDGIRVFVLNYSQVMSDTIGNHVRGGLEY